MEEITLNITLKINKHDVINFENWLRDNLEVISVNHIRNTSELYKNDETFKKLVKNVKKATKEKDVYAMNNNHKYIEQFNEEVENLLNNNQINE